MHARFKLTTRFETVQQFVVGFSACDGGSMFLKTDRACVRGERCTVTILLANKQQALAGSWEVLDVFDSADNPFGARGIRVKIERLSPESERVYAKLLTARAPRRLATVPGIAPVRRVATVSIPPLEASTPDEPPIEALPLPPPPAAPPPVLAEGTAQTRAPMPRIVLPANPFAGVTDASLAGLVDTGWLEARPAPAVAVPVAAPIVAAVAAPPPRKRRHAWIAAAVLAGAAAAGAFATWTALAATPEVAAVPEMVDELPTSTPVVETPAAAAAMESPAATPVHAVVSHSVRRAPRVAKKPDIERPPI